MGNKETAAGILYAIFFILMSIFMIRAAVYCLEYFEEDYYGEEQDY